MSFITRSFVRSSRLQLLPAISRQPCRLAHQSYGNDQSGHPQARDEKNPKEHLEHPGPEAPNTKGESSSSSQTTQSKSQSSSSNGAEPKIHAPKSAAEDTDPEVKKHNEEMAQRPERSANQLGEEDNKVDKNFWKGNAGDIKSDK